MESPEPFVGSYLIVFVDILGQRRLLSEMAALPDQSDPAQMEQFRTLLKKTVGMVNRLRQSFRQFFEHASPPRDPEGLTPDQRILYKQATNNPLESQALSDFVVISLSLRDDSCRLPMRGVYSALFSAASTFITMLAEGCPIRGGIDLGLGVELSDGDVYGPALVRAHALESQIAQYPRIIIGDHLKQYLDYQRLRPETDVFATLNKKLAEATGGLLAVDDDGYPFLDYLGEGLPSIRGVLGQKTITNAREFITKESIRYQQEKNSKLAFRYTLLRNYFDHRLAMESDEECVNPSLSSQ